MGNLDPTTQMLLTILIGMIIIVFVLIIVYVLLKMKSSKEKLESSNKETSKEKPTTKKIENNVSIFDFMEFDKVEDNMIVQKNGSKYVMVIECQGVNYDLMSGIEKTGVEEGFVQFLNTLRTPIQLYIQTRTINLENSINGYKQKVNEIEVNLNKMKMEYQEMINSDNYSQEDLDKVFFEITKQTNLYEYGRDVIYDTERMSLNRNILNKKYYIVTSYYASDLGNNSYDKNEIQSMAFSELYNRSQSMIRSISSCGVNGKILNSLELSELLYMAYNRDDAELFDLKKAIGMGYDRLYSTAQDVLEKRIKELDKIIEQKAADTINNTVEKIKTKNRKALDTKEESIEDLADEMARLLLEENKSYLGNDVVDEIVEELDKGGESNEKKKTRRRKTSTNQ